MKTLIITYDLNDPGKNYPDLLKKIKAYGTWAKIGGSVYLVNTDREPKEVRDDLVTVLDKNDQIFICPAPLPSAWRGLSKEVSDWIMENQE